MLTYHITSNKRLETKPSPSDNSYWIKPFSWKKYFNRNKRESTELDMESMAASKILSPPREVLLNNIFLSFFRVNMKLFWFCFCFCFFDRMLLFIFIICSSLVYKISCSRPVLVVHGFQAGRLTANNHCQPNTSG